MSDLQEGILKSDRTLTPRADGGSLALAERLMVRWAGSITHGNLTVKFPGGHELRVEGQYAGPDAKLILHRHKAVWRMLMGGDTAFAKSYAAGDWDTPDLTRLLEFGAINESALEEAVSGTPLMRAWTWLQHRGRANTRRGSRRNISFHYDLGNDFYRRWLDPTMTYSSALFKDDDETLAAAQRNKYRRLAEAIEVGRGDDVLEIGCGWGGFMEVAAAEYGANVRGLTLSREQRTFATERLAGLGEQAVVDLCDYRDCQGRYDAIASIEMFEAIGESNWPNYMEALGRLLKPGGRAGIQVITIDPARFDKYRRTPDFIQTYIFPGGMLPTPDVFEAKAEAAGLRVEERFFFGADYAATLARWRRQFLGAWPEIAALGFDERFRRLWSYYLSYCEAGFRTGATDVAQYVLVRP
jgi:cyclopropane-fatty-acyl-phospholipid synthase